VRPELAVLLAYAKLVLYDELLAADLPDDPQLGGELLRYFPERLQQRFAESIAAHRLRREIIATVVTNEMANRVGITFVHEVRETTGMGPADIARAYIAARGIFGMDTLWQSIEDLDNEAPASLQTTLLLEAGRALHQGVVWLLRNEPQPLDIARNIETYRAALTALIEAKGLITEADRAEIERRAAVYTKAGSPKALADHAAILGLLPPSLDIVRISRSTGTPIEQVGRTYFAVGAKFGFDWLRRAAATLPSENHWDKLAVVAITDDLFGHQRELTARVLADVARSPSANGAEPFEGWISSRGPMLQRTETLLNDLRQSGTLGLAMLAVANRQLRNLTAN